MARRYHDHVIRLGKTDQITGMLGKEIKKTLFKKSVPGKVNQPSPGLYGLNLRD
jgi:hypothetical protein